VPAETNGVLTTRRRRPGISGPVRSVPNRCFFTAFARNADFTGEKKSSKSRWNDSDLTEDTINGLLARY